MMRHLSSRVLRRIALGRCAAVASIGASLLTFAEPALPQRTRSAAVAVAHGTPPARWRVETHRLVWQVDRDARLPHGDRLEMSGQRVSVIVSYDIGAQRELRVSRLVIWPDLRSKLNAVRGYLQHRFTDDEVALGTLDGTAISRGTAERVEFDGTVHLRSRSGQLAMRTDILPSATERSVIERVTLRNLGAVAVRYAPPGASAPVSRESETGTQLYRHAVRAPASRMIAPRDSVVLEVAYSASTSSVPFPAERFDDAARARRALIGHVSDNLQLVTPDNAINGMFHFAKIRAAESLFATKMGLVHSPGGGRYYGGIWANDQAEYSGPFFPFLGWRDGNTAALTAYRVFAGAMRPDYRQIPYSFEVEGYAPYSHVERGDAAMYAYGASRFALVRGDSATAAELWPSIQWALEFCRRKRNAAGVIESESDELEGRFPSGRANLATTSLAYGAWLVSADLAAALGRPAEAAALRTEAAQLRAALSAHFAATVGGFETYRYYEGGTALRSWISLPLVMGITDRANGTADALFSPQMWSADGLATIAGDSVFWDRATLYAFNGLFRAGLTDRALEKLGAYSRRRLLQDHVPYAVEASPEGNQAHLSAESALYARAIIEGVFGVWPTGLRSFDMTVSLPSGWNQMALKRVNGFGRTFDIAVSRVGAMLRVVVTSDRQVVVDRRVATGAVVQVTFPNVRR
jgi:hypothetical protein